MLQKCSNPNSNRRISTARTVYDRIREDRSYPDVQTYKLSEVHTERDVPNNFNGPKGDPIAFRCANIMEVHCCSFISVVVVIIKFTILCRSLFRC